MGSFESVTQHEGCICTPDGLNECSLEVVEVVGGEEEEDAFKVRPPITIGLMIPDIIIIIILISHDLCYSFLLTLNRTRLRKMKAVRISPKNMRLWKMMYYWNALYLPWLLELELVDIMMV